MDFETIANKIRIRFEEQVAVKEAIIVRHDNQDTDAPPSDFWCRVSVLFGESSQVDMADKKRFRYPGVLIVGIFGKIGTGTKQIFQLADKIKIAFRSVSADSVFYQSPSITTVGQKDGWFQVNVNCPWYSDDVEI